jgi:glycerophosphoryl diester phosphodiesterase
MRGLLFAMVVVGGLAAMAQTSPPRVAPLVAAHRGGALLWPENSLLAFRNALVLGVDYLELDVHLSRDDQVMVLHDPTLDRTTTATGPVAARSAAELSAIRLKDRGGSVTAESVPTLDQVAELAARAGRQLLVEIKVDPDGQRYPRIEERVLEVLDRHRMVGASIVMAFEPTTWLRVRELHPSIRTGALLSARVLQTSGWTLAVAIDTAAKAGVAFIGLHHDLVTEPAVTQARMSSIVLGAWTVNQPEAIRRVIDRGIGVVISDRPDLVKSLLER